LLKVASVEQRLGEVMINIASFVSTFIMLFALGLGTSHKINSQASSETVRTPVLVELFTSEGCSSCPPADALLRRLVEQQPIAGAEIIALEEHVDYWNHDGWVDPYSSAEWTRRQQDYVAINGEDAYTPELVIDGHSQFVGNDAQKAGREIEKAARALKTEVTITPEKADVEGSQQLKVSVGKLDRSKTGSDVAEVWLAITEDGLHSSVTRGENSGRNLQHACTLRSLKKIGVADTNTSTSMSFTRDIRVNIDPHWDITQLRVTVFVQNRKNKEILGAAAVRTSQILHALSSPERSDK
jgi:hypothetical protein